MAGQDSLLQKLFTRKTINKQMANGRIKTVDFDRLQAINTNINGGYTGIKSSIGAAGSLYGISTYTNQNGSEIDAIRNQLYLEYESMDTDAILAGSLDIYADESTIVNEHGQLLTIDTDDDNIKRVLYNLYHEILNVDFNIWHWIRSLCKFGDLFLYLHTLPSIGVVDVTSIHPSLIKRNDMAGPNQDMTQYIYDGDGASYSTAGLNRNVFSYHEIAHFRIVTDTNFLPYGKSMLEGARKIWKQLTLMEDAMLISRIMRAPERRIIKVDVGQMDPASIDAYMEKITNQMKKVPFIDPQTGDYNLRFNMMNILEDFYMPVRGSESGTSIETLDGLKNEGSLEDIEYLRNKMMSFLKIPKAYLGYDEGVEGKGTLAAEDVKFARFIERIQKIVTAELENIGYIHLYMQGFKDEDLANFKLKLSTPSLIYERQKVDLLNEKVNLISNLLEQRMFSRKYIYENIFNLTEDEWQAEQDAVIEDLKQTFRQEQIATEGNDPFVSGKSFGTKHDLATLYISQTEEQKAEDIRKLYTPDGRTENPGRPEEYGSFESEDDPSLGRDPSGRLAMQTPLTMHREHNKINKSLERLLGKGDLQISMELIKEDLV